MFSRFIFWPWFTGLIFLVAGLVIARPKLIQARGLEKLLVLGPIFFAVPLAIFGAEHLAGPQFLLEVVPAWMPARLFWVYFVGLALECSAISILIGRQVRLSAALLGAMFFLFVLTIHIPIVAAHPRDRFSWTVALRDLAFGGAAWALAGSQSRDWRPSSFLVDTGRFCVAIPVIFFGVEHFLHPTFAPGVPLQKMTPPWVPLAPLWGYLTGAVLLVAGIALLLRKKDSLAAIWAGLLITLLTFVIYLPLLPMASSPDEMNVATNYIGDTLLFAGTILVMAGALPEKRSAATSV